VNLQRSDLRRREGGSGKGDESDRKGEWRHMGSVYRPTVKQREAHEKVNKEKVGPLDCLPVDKASRVYARVQESMYAEMEPTDSKNVRGRGTIKPRRRSDPSLADDKTAAARTQRMREGSDIG
jgi:hypothetical protein